MRILFLMFSLSIFLFAHKLNLFLVEEDNKVYVNAYFASGAFCKNCKIEIFDENKNLLEESVTDISGEFVISKTKPFLYVKVEASGGHARLKSIKLKKQTIDTTSDLKTDALIKENKKLKREIEVLNKKLEENELVKMIFALFVIAGIFFILKRIKR
jgi:nickel transport protein